MPDLGNLQEFLPWLISTAGLIFFATWLKIAFDHLRNPRGNVEYSPYVEKLSELVTNLNPLQMQTLSLVAFVVPVVVVYVVVNYVPAEWILAIQPHVAFIVSVLLVYSGQQWVHRQSKAVNAQAQNVYYSQPVVQEATNVTINPEKSSKAKA